MGRLVSDRGASGACSGGGEGSICSCYNGSERVSFIDIPVEATGRAERNGHGWGGPILVTIDTEAMCFARGTVCLLEDFSLFPDFSRSMSNSMLPPSGRRQSAQTIEQLNSHIQVAEAYPQNVHKRHSRESQDGVRSMEEVGVPSYSTHWMGLSTTPT